MVDVSEVAKSLRLVGLTEVDEAADLIEQQAARVTALESERDALLAAAGKEAGAIYQVQTSCNGWTDHSREEYEGARLPRRVVYTAPAAALENGDGRDAWISVEERLPENDQIVAFVVKAEQESPNWHLNGHVLGGTYHENWGFSTPGVGHRASHWMPLPAAPAALSQKAGEQQ